MVPLIFTDGRAAVAFYAPLAAWMALEVRTAYRSRARKGQGKRLDRGSRLVVLAGFYVGGFLAFVLAVRVPAAVLPGPPWGAVLAGVAVLLGGLALRAWSIRSLGSWFTYDVRVSNGQRIVTSGPYRLLRHPSYTGALLCSAGVGLALGNGLGVLTAVLLPLAGVLRRVRVEEAALLGELGSEYAAYCRTTKRLVPGVW